MIRLALSRIQGLLATSSRPRLDRPIFVVGCAKSGTSALGLILQDHPAVGPKAPQGAAFASIQQLLGAMLDDSFFDVVAHEMEEKAAWDRYFPIGDVSLRIGPELAQYRCDLGNAARWRFVSLITRNFREERFLSKQPFNTFRIHVLRELFPDAKIVGIHRDGADVVASWGRKQNRWEAFGGYAAAIPLLAAKWTAAVRHIEDHKAGVGVYTLRYEELIAAPEPTLRSLLEYCELPYPEDRYAALRLADRRGSWRARIPEEFQSLLLECTREWRERLGYAR